MGLLNRKLQKKYLKLSQTQLIEHLLIIYVCFFYPDFEPDSSFFSALRVRINGGRVYLCRHVMLQKFYSYSFISIIFN